MTDQLNRRTVLAGGAAAAAVVATAACKSQEPVTAATPGGPVTVPAAEVPVGGGTIDRANKVVVTQPTSGTYAAFSAICPHQGCTVSKVEDSGIVCVCHGSVFDTATGARKEGPANDGLAKKKVTQTGDRLTVS